MDYAGPFQGKMFLVIVDAFSKCIEVKIVNTETASATIEHCGTVLQFMDCHK